MNRPELVKTIGLHERQLQPLVDELLEEFKDARLPLSVSAVDLIQELSKCVGSYARIMEIRSETKRALDQIKGHAAFFHGDENAKSMEMLVDGDVFKVAHAYNLASGLSYVLKLRIESIRSIIAFNREEMGAIQ